MLGIVPKSWICCASRKEQGENILFLELKLVIIDDKLKTKFLIFSLSHSNLKFLKHYMD